MGFSTSICLIWVKSWRKEENKNLFTNNLELKVIAAEVLTKEHFIIDSSEVDPLLLVDITITFRVPISNSKDSSLHYSFFHL